MRHDKPPMVQLKQCSRVLLEKKLVVVQLLEIFIIFYGTQKVLG
jgi:hypothetical protein